MLCHVSNVEEEVVVIRNGLTPRKEVVIVHWFCAIHILRILFICILILFFPIIIIV